MRSFIAISIPATVKAEIGEIIERLRHASPPAHWVPTGNLHVTVKFLDEIRESQIPPIVGAITMAVGQVCSFPLRLGGFGFFPNERKARIFWIGIESGFEPLKALAKAIDQELTPLGFEQETRPFAAHITLARLRESGPVERLAKESAHVQYLSLPISVSQVDLMRSVLSPAGAEYSIIGSVPLRAPDQT